MQFLTNFYQTVSGTPFPFGTGYPLVLFARGIRELHAAPIMLAIYR
jgi:hypothetical protein